MKGVIVFFAVLAVAYSSVVRPAPRAEPVCKDLDGFVTNFPNVDDCTTFWVCIMEDMEALFMHCKKGLWFNPLIETCDDPANVPEGVCTVIRH